MIFLPIAARELRVAARKRSTFWLRIVAALVGLMIGGGCLILAGISMGSGMSPGRTLFGALTWLAIPVVLSAGLFLTSDCLSEEKREGTLGFLFLTDLRGYDVVAGKLLATSLRGLYALLAVLPILAVTLILGGVTGVQFFKTSLALVNALFCSLVAGLLVSSISRDSQKAMGATLLLLLCLIGGGPLADIVIKGLGGGFQPWLSFTSPWFVFTSAGGWGKSPFWYALMTTQVMAWIFLALTCWLVPRTWQEKPKAEAAPRGKAFWWRYGSGARSVRIRHKLIDRNPVLWLACRERWQSLVVWGMGVVMAGALLIPIITGLQAPFWIVTNGLGGLFIVMLYFWIASQACRFFVEARNCGLLEQLLGTPLTERQIVSGLWGSLVRMIGPPMILLILVNLTGTVFSQRALSTATFTVKTSTQFGTNSPVVTTNQTGTPIAAAAGVGAGGSVPLWPAVVSAAVSGLATIANLIAFAWVGMWMGVTTRSASLATLKTIAFAGIIPWLGLTFAASIGTIFLMMPRLLKGGTGPSSQVMVWYPVLMAAVGGTLSLGKDLVFVLWARRKLYSSLRGRVLEGIGATKDQPPLLPPVIAAGSTVTGKS